MGLAPPRGRTQFVRRGIEDLKVGDMFAARTLIGRGIELEMYLIESIRDPNRQSP